ncbi:MAG TPA: type VI secretion system baseplate subunit TssG, partial [Aquabacterium sp.]|nr:type VI secretion system baseplate subunit TssG [Aquabacterium sp.]
MPPTQRIDATGVIGRLLATPQQFGFFQAVRVLDRWLDIEHPNGRGIDRIHFRNSTSLSFPASEIEALSLHVEFGRHESAASALVSPTQVDRVTLTPAFMGLLGVSGTLPTFYTEAISQRELYQKDHGPRAFMDFFSHRAVHLFYGAWKKF